jgi:iron complex transport system permease protein
LNTAGSSDKPAVRRVLLFALLAAAVFVLLLGDIAMGSVSIPPGDILRALAGRTLADPTAARIVIDFRLPKALTALLSGAALAASGLILQTLFGNPLAGPDVLGLNAGASMGAALLVLGASPRGGSALFAFIPGSLGPIGMALASSAGAAAVLLVVLAISMKAEGNAQVLIAGLMIGFIANSLVSFLVYSALPQEVSAYLSWTFGSFQGAGPAEVPVFAAVCASGALGAILLSKPLDALLLGPRYARSMGLGLGATRTAAIIVSSVLGGAVTAFCGPVAFLGIAAPHAARALTGSQRHAVLTPAALLTGASMALAADILTQFPRDGSVLPLNALLSLIGAPVVLFLVLKRGREILR